MEVDTLNAFLAGRPKSASSDRRTSPLYKAAMEFEGHFISYLMKEMLKSSPGGLFGDNFQGEIYQGLFLQELGKQLGRANQLGLAEMIYEQLEGRAGSEAQAEGADIGSSEARVED